MQRTVDPKLEDKGSRPGLFAALLVSAFTFSCVAASAEHDGAIDQVSVPLLSGTALYVASSSILGTADAAVRNRLQSLGLTVVTRSARSSATADASGKALVVISSTVSPSYVGSKFRSVAVPVLTWESGIYDDMGMTPTTFGNAGTQSSLRSVTILTEALSHPLTAGLSGTATVGAASTTFNWGRPGASAVRIATIPGNSSRVAVFGYEQGAAMPGLVAPARRVALFLGDSTASALNASGWALFEAAVSWALSAGDEDDDDDDNDRLRDVAETNTGVFVDSSNTGTDPNDPDSDGDGLFDGDEVLGTTAGLNLPAMGCNPLRKHILLEHDWFEDAFECVGGSHSHRPTAAALDRVNAAFAAAPVANPDGTTGITLIHDYGQGGLFTGGNRIADSDGLIDGVTMPEFAMYKRNHFAANRSGYFHYAIHAHRTPNESFIGQAETRGDDIILSLRCIGIGADYNVAITFMHELGHNLGLSHGGNVHDPYKPNYNSVMSYVYSWSGVDTNCTPQGDGVLDYSYGTRITLDETALLEPAGICGNVPWDWSANGAIDSGPVQADLNRDAIYSTLTDYDDWANLVYDWDGVIASLAQADGPAVVSCDNPPPRPLTGERQP